MKTARILRPLAAALAAFAFACSDSTGVEMGEIEVTMQMDGGVVELVDGWYASLTGTEGSLDPDTVASLTITVTELEFLPGVVGDGVPNEGDWISVTLATPLDVDLMALPTEGDSPLVIAAGSVPVGDYRHVRIFVSDATIVFKGDIEINPNQTFDGGVEHPVEIPSVEQTGITTDITFTVVGDDLGDPTDVGLLFAPDATMANVTANGAGAVILTPIISAAVGSGS